MKTEFYELDKLNNVSELIQKRYNSLKETNY